MSEAIGRALESKVGQSYLYERYGRIALSFGAYFDGIEKTIQIDSNGQPFSLIYNKNRTKRFGPLPSFSDSLRDFQNSNFNNIIFYDEYWPYIVAANPAPIEYGALTLIRFCDGRDVLTINNEITQNNLEILVTLSDELGVRIFHNLDGAGASKLEPHSQGLLGLFNVEFMRKEEINRHKGIYTLPDYPGENVIFIGERKIEKSLEFIEYLKSGNVDRRSVPNVILIANKEIYIVPIFNDRAPHEVFGLDSKSRIAGCECGNLAYVALNEEDYERVKRREKVRVNGGEVELCVKEILKRALYEKGMILKCANKILG